MISISNNIQEQVTTSLDYIAQLYDLIRFENESVDDFRRRLLDIFLYDNSNTINGIANRITRELGGLIKELGSISPRKDEDGSLVGLCPVIEITETHIIFYSNFLENEIEKKFNIYNDLPHGNEELAYYIYDIYAWLSTSSYFQINKDISNNDLFLQSKYLVNNLSCRLISEEHVVEINRCKLNFDKEKETLIASTFNSSDSRLIESVDSIDLILSSGDYFLDETNGYLYFYETNDRTSMRLEFYVVDKETYVDYRPVKITSLHNNNVFYLNSLIDKDKDNLSYRIIAYNEYANLLISLAYQQDIGYWFNESINNTPIDIKKSYLTSEVFDENFNISSLYSNDNLRLLLEKI